MSYVNQKSNSVNVIKKTNMLFVRLATSILGMASTVVSAPTTTIDPTTTVSTNIDNDNEKNHLILSGVGIAIGFAVISGLCWGVYNRYCDNQQGVSANANNMSEMQSTQSVPTQVNLVSPRVARHENAMQQDYIQNTMNQNQVRY